MSPQEQLQTGVDPSQASDSTAVYAVVVRWEGSPHPDVLGVYDDKGAAKELMKRCRDWPREWDTLGPVAWELREREVQSEFDPEALDV